METEGFFAKWRDNFNRSEILMSEKDVDYALKEAKRFLAKIDLLKEDFNLIPFQGEKMVFEPNDDSQPEVDLGELYLTGVDCKCKHQF